MKLSRRSFMKANAVAAAAAAAGLSALSGSRKPSNGIKRRAVFAERGAVCWWERSRAVWSPARATPTRRSTVV